jgi:succinate dehydrogenase / fumarate reductase iron-sulfur subunit
MDQFPEGQPIRVEPMRRFPLIRDLVTDVSRNYEVNKRIQPFTPKPREADGTYRMQQYDIDRLQEFHKCIECFLCQDVCHVLRDHGRNDFAGPRFMVRIASLAMHPLDTANRMGELRDAFGIGLCNITKCCTEVCPEDIHITDNAIIPLKERVAGAFYDPIAWVWRFVRGKQAGERQAD